MSGIGEKIKEALTGHSSSKDTSDVKTPDVNAPGAYPIDDSKVTEGHTNLTKLGHQHRDSEIGAGHTQGRHDPEVDAKEATSQAGNYPYWGDLPREGEQGASHQHGTTGIGGTHGGDSHNFQKGSALTGGALATGAGLSGAGAAVTGSRESEYSQRPLGTQDTTSTTQNLTDRTRDTGLSSSTQDPSTTTQNTRDGHKGEIAAATGAGVAGATYLGTHHKNDQPTRDTTSDLSSGPTQAGPGRLDGAYASQTSSSAAKPQEFTNIASADSPYATQAHNSHRKEEEALAAGAGAAGLGGAGYLAHKRAEDHSRADERPTTAYGSQQQRETTSGLTSSTDSPYAAAHGDNSHRKEEGALAAGAGAAGLGGAGYLAHKRPEDNLRADERPTTVHSSQQRDTTSGLPQATTGGGGIHNTVVGAGSTEDPHARAHKKPFDSGLLSSSNTTTVGPQHGSSVDPREQQTISSALGAPTSSNDREKQGLAAAAGVGAGAGVVAAEEKHRHHEHRRDDQPKDQSHSVFGSSHNKNDENTHHDKHTHSAQTTSASQPSAQLAAQQAWNKQNQGGTTTGTRHDPEDEARQATSAAGNYPYQSGDRSSSSTTGTHHNSAALGTAAGAAGLAGAGATAAYYGQGKEHDQNPRSAESEKIAERALGSDGAAHAPSSDQGQGQSTSSGVTSTHPSSGLSSAGVGGAGLSSGGSGQGLSKVVHKCHQCGADNDISDYFKKDAGFRAGS